MTTDITTARVSSYLHYLPAIFQEDADQDGMTFIGRFLLAFEKILSGLGDPGSPGLEEIVAGIDTYFKPGPLKRDESPPPRTPDEFLPWLASWVALTLRADWGPEEQRSFLSQIVPLYRLRGTKAGLEKMLRIYTDMGVEVSDDEKDPYFFQVSMFFTEPNQALLKSRKRIAMAIIDQEKPAHTYYHLETYIPTMQVGIHSTVGVDTFLGKLPPKT